MTGLLASLSSCDPDPPPDDGADEAARPFELPADFRENLTRPLPEEGVPWVAAHSLALASDLAYDSESTIRQSLTSHGFPDCQQCNDGETSAFVAISPGVTLVAFRGTNARNDWLTNLHAFKQPVAHGQLHRGFFTAFGAIRGKIMALLNQAHSPQSNLWITGHSLGGALSIVCAHSFLETSRPFTAVMTYGQPMVTDLALASYLAPQWQGRYWRFVNEADIVTRVPPFYRHFGRRVWFRGNTVEISDEIPSGWLPWGAPPAGPDELEPLSAHQFETFKEQLRAEKVAEVGMEDERRTMGESLSIVADHGIDHYINAVARQLPP